MYICDGSVVAANLGVNPSLTITALAERAMSFIPPAAETDWNDGAAGAMMPDARLLHAEAGGAVAPGGSKRSNSACSPLSHKRPV